MGQVWLFFVLCQKQGIDPATGRSPLRAVGFHPSDALCDYSELSPLCAVSEGGGRLWVKGRISHGSCSQKCMGAAAALLGSVGGIGAVMQQIQSGLQMPPTSQHSSGVV